MTNLQARSDVSMSAELQQVVNGFVYRVKSFGAYDVNGYRFHMTKHEQIRPNRRTTNTGVFTPGDDGLGSSTTEHLKKYTNYRFMGLYL